MDNPADVTRRLMQLPKVAWNAFKKLSDSKKDFENIKAQKDMYLAVVSMKYEGSEAKIKRLALADPDFKSFIVRSNLAERKLFEATARVEAVKVELACLQSVVKILVEEKNIGNYQP